jgi:hypothetical protein
MAQIQRVLPGDLITAQQMNAMIDAINALEAQISGLSTTQTNQVVITDLVPPSGTVKVNNELQVLGQNFRFLAGGLQVYIDDQRVNVLTSATDTKLVFNIPGTIVVPQAGRPGVLTVNNGLTTAQRTLSLLPALILSGAVDVIANGTTPTTPVPGLFTLNFRLRSRASIDTTFVIDPVVSVPAWQSSVQVLQAQVVVPARQITLAAGAETTFAVTLTIPPATNGTAFNVVVTATSGQVAGTSGAQAFTVGAAAPQPDPTITLGFSASSQVFGTGTISSGVVSLAAGASATVRLSATFTIATTYDITAVFIGATNWEVKPVLASTPSPMTITAADLQATGTAAKTLEFGVRPLAGATNGKIEFRVLRTGQSQPRTFSMEVQTV